MELYKESPQPSQIIAQIELCDGSVWVAVFCFFVDFTFRKGGKSGVIKAIP